MKGIHPVLFFLLLVLISLPFGCRSWWSFKPNYGEAPKQLTTNHYGN